VWRLSEDYEKEKLSGLEKLRTPLFSCGTLDNGTVTNGGRVLVTSYGNDFQEAIKILSKYRQATF
jgi:phosphoribosylamine-glycine ligase